MVPSEQLEPRKFRVITYIDGFNLYFGIRNEAFKQGTRDEPHAGWYRFMWLDVTKLSSGLLTSQQSLVITKYFTSQISGSKDKEARQNAFLDALRTLPLISFTFGHFQNDPKECDNCGHRAYHPQEKKTDVNIATHLICDAVADEFDTAILVTADSDLVPAVQAVHKLRPEKRVIAAFPPSRNSKELEDVTGFRALRIRDSLLRKCLLPERIIRPGLPDVIRPFKYSGIPGCTARMYEPNFIRKPIREEI